jgi:hypothetical protein
MVGNFGGLLVEGLLAGGLVAGGLVAGALLGSAAAELAGSGADCPWAEAVYNKPGNNTAVKAS